ncbi:MAG: hypothetical protein LH468_05290 [Nocardioides sp.]|nr:hypothetical protein [Nocardioides sp.]
MVLDLDVFPCPCCGHLTLAEPPGSFALCPVCFWEDDPVQLRWPDYSGGANGVSLVEGQRNFLAFEAMALTFRGNVREAKASEPVDWAGESLTRRVILLKPRMSKTLHGRTTSRRCTGGVLRFGGWTKAGDWLKGLFLLEVGVA